MNSFCCTTPHPPLPCVHVHPTLLHPPQRRALLHLPPRALRALRLEGATTHPAQPGTTLRRRTMRLAGAVPAHRRAPRRSTAPAPRLSPGARITRPAHHSRAARQGTHRRRLLAGRPAPRLPTRRRRLPGAAPPPLGRCGARRAVGHEPARTACRARTLGHRCIATRRRPRLGHRAHGPARLRARHPALAARTQRPGRAPGRGLRNDGADAPVPRLRCPDGPPRGHRTPSLRPRDAPVRPAPDGHPLRPDQYLLRGRGGSATESPARTLQGQTHRPPTPDPGTGARRQRLRTPLAGLRRQRARAPHPRRDARCPPRPAQRPGGDGPRHRHL